DSSVYGSATSFWERINHIATHNLFTSTLEQFLKVYARIVFEARQSLEDTFTNWDRHEPHYALFLAFLHLLEHARMEMNTITGRHLDFYYREILQLRGKAAEPGKVHLLVELAKQASAHLMKEGALFPAAKDDLGNEAFFAGNRDFVANQAKVAALKTVYRHTDEPAGKPASLKNKDRLYASPVANSDDGLGAELTSADQSWHPFHNKIYQDGALSKINMPKAEIGFALASHYLLMAEGKRTVTVNFSFASVSTDLPDDCKEDILCLFTGAKGWLEKAPAVFNLKTGELKIELSGADPAVVPNSIKLHGSDFTTDLPILIVKLLNKEESNYIYSQLQDLVIKKIDLTVDVGGLKTLVVSNDYGLVDLSKPFQPFGPSPKKGSSFIVGSKEVFQKELSEAAIDIQWQSAPVPYDKNMEIKTEYLQGGIWQQYNDVENKNSIQAKASSSNFGKAETLSNASQMPFSNFSEESLMDEMGNIIENIKKMQKLSQTISILGDIKPLAQQPYIDAPDLLEEEIYSSSSRHGFIRFSLTDDFGQSDYEEALITYIANKINKVPDTKPVPPIGPFISGLKLNYTAKQSIDLENSDKPVFENRPSRFFHLAPFGQAEQHPFLNSANEVHLLPQFTFDVDNFQKHSEAEFYIGVTGLKPPQNLAILFQVADGTADPLSINPSIQWSYLRNNEWMPFAKNEIEDNTGGLLNSGIITFAVPDEASDNNTLLPPGMHWIKAAVENESDAVCRLIMVAAQALVATFVDKGNDPAFPAKVLAAGTINKLDQPTAAVKKIIQPFESFGGRGKEESPAFYTRISERLRHKDRAIAMWDYERLVLEAFPQIYKVKCLNHTEYEPDETGNGIYRELAPGHVTVVTIPNQQYYNLRDPLRPYTSLGLLKQIESFLGKRFSCFTSLHVKNPEFEEVRVEFNVCLKEGSDETYCITELQKALTRFLSPWAFPEGGSPSFGGKIYKSVLINFVEEQEYVDCVTNFKLFHQEIDKDEVEGSKSVSILVSAREHNITPIKIAEADKPGEKYVCEK
ncbi:MAG: baseplate J/gp47 family protein, partial [Smithella sp.]